MDNDDNNKPPSQDKKSERIENRKKLHLFRKGESGNPSGMPKSIASLTRTLWRLLTREEAENIIKALMKLAAGGNIQAIRFIAELLKEVGPLSQAVNIQVNNSADPALLEKARKYAQQVETDIPNTISAEVIGDNTTASANSEDKSGIAEEANKEDIKSESGINEP